MPVNDAALDSFVLRSGVNDKKIYIYDFKQGHNSILPNKLDFPQREID